MVSNSMNAAEANGHNKRPAEQFRSGSSQQDDVKPLAKKMKYDSSDDDEDMPLAPVAPSVKAEASKDGYDSDVPLHSVVSSQDPAGNVKAESDSDSESDEPLKFMTKNRRGSGDSDSNSDEDEDDDDDDGDEDGDEDGDSTIKSKAPKSMSITGSGDKKWDTLVHKGPRFPEPYVPLPPDVTLKYEGKPVRLSAEVEEVAMFYAVKLETQHASNAIFNRNFFEDFQSDLKKYPPKDGTKIKSFDKLDFRDMYNHWKSLRDAETDRKKALAPSARKREIEERKAGELQWKICLVDGVEQKVGNVNVEPPGLFLGRGAHPKAGRVKRRIYPSDVTINHSSDHPIPRPPPGLGNWAEVVEKKDVTWLAYWKENINGAYKYVFLDATSKFKTNSDRDKFEKARRLDTVVKKIRADVNKNLKSKVRHERTIATIVWLIDNFSLRAGNEKGEDEAETFGVCSLRCEHAQVLPPDTIHLEFLGKDSMKFEENLKLSNPDVFKNMAMFLKTNGMKDKAGNFVRKKPSDPIFCAPTEGSSNKMQPLAPMAVNNFLSQYMKGLSAKVFRTYNASVTFQGLLEQTDEWLKTRPTPQEREINPVNLRVAYNEANRQVAILCNHQKTVNPLLLSKNLERSQDKIFQIRYDIMKEQQKILSFHTVSNLKKEYAVKEHPFMKQLDKIMQPQKLDADKVKQFEEQMVTDKKAKLESTFQRQQSELLYQSEQKGLGVEENKKKTKKEKDLEEDIKSSIKGFKDKKQVDDEIKALEETLKRLEKERKSNKSQATSCNFVSSAKKILSKYEAIKKQEAELTNKNNTSDVALGTSKLNYIDPRITLAWLKKWDDMLMGKGQGKAASRKKVKKEEDDVKPTKKGKVAKGSDKGGTALADSEKMDLGLQVLNMGQFFANALQKKFKWAATGDDGRDISAKWEFVEKSQTKMRKFDSAARKGDGAASGSMAAMTDAANSPKANGTLKKQTSVDRKMNKPITAVDKEEDSSDDDDKPLAAA